VASNVYANASPLGLGCDHPEPDRDAPPLGRDHPEPDRDAPELGRDDFEFPRNNIPGRCNQFYENRYEL
jgi:hypothetical protein